MTDAAPPAGARTLYGRRRGKALRRGQATLVSELLPRLAIPVDHGPLDPAALFGRPLAGVWLEVGFGAGEHLAAQARARPEIGFLGCEPFVNGMARLLRSIETERLDNVRLHADDARTLLAVLSDHCLGRCFVLFPDPWPKTRHARRRFIQPDTLDQLARCLAPGAELRLASDDPGLVDWMLWQTRRHPAFAWMAEGAADWRHPDDAPETRYERKALAAGRRPAFLRFRRRAVGDA